MRISSLVTLVVIKVTTCELVRSRERLTIGAEFSLECSQVKSKELIFVDELCLVFMKHVAIDSQPTSVVRAFAGFIYKGVIKEFK